MEVIIMLIMDKESLKGPQKHKRISKKQEK